MPNAGRPGGATTAATKRSEFLDWLSYQTWIFLRRRNFFVNRKLQSWMLRLALLYVLSFATVISVSLFLPLILSLFSAEASSEEAAASAVQFLYLHSHFWPAAILALLAIGFHSIFSSHKIAGPLYRMKLNLESLKQGTIPEPIRLRRGDALQDEIKLLNETIIALEARLSEIGTAQEGLHEAITLCSRESSSGRLRIRLDAAQTLSKDIGRKIQNLVTGK